MDNINVALVQQLLTLVTVVVLATAALLTVGFGGFIMVIRQHGSAIEKIYLSASPETQKLIRDIATGVKQVGDVADKLTDGVIDEQPTPQG